MLASHFYNNTTSAEGFANERARRLSSRSTGGSW